MLDSQPSNPSLFIPALFSSAKSHGPLMGACSTILFSGETASYRLCSVTLVGFSVIVLGGHWDGHLTKTSTFYIFPYNIHSGSFTGESGPCL
jgi:hypothetical protein